MISRELFRERWLDCINELTSLELQNASWLDNKNTNPHWSFVEFWSSYMDDLPLDLGYDYYLSQGFVSRDEFRIVQPWHEALLAYNAPKGNNYDHAAILNDPEWIRIAGLGLKVKEQLSPLLDENEKQILFAHIDYSKF